MNAFKTAFSNWLDSQTHSLRAVAIQAGIANGELSRVRTGAKSITMDSITKLLPAVQRLSSRSHARALLVAYLHDETPPDFEPDIRISAIDTTGHPDLDAIALTRDRWEAKARSDAEFAKMWLTVDGYMHEPDASAVDARMSELAPVAEPATPYVVTRPPHTTGGSHGGHDTIRHDAMPSQHVAKEHEQP